MIPYMKTSFEKILQFINALIPYAIARAIPVSLNVIAIPIILRNTGVETYGLITLIISFIAIQVLADLGAVNSFLPIFVRTVQDNDLDEAKSMFLSIIIRIFCHGCFFSLIALPAVLIFLRNANIENDQVLTSDFNFAIYLILFSNVFAGFVPLSNYILLVYKKNRLSSILNSSSNSAIAIIMVLTSFLEAPIIPMTFGIIFTPIIISLFTLIWISKKNDLLNFNNTKWNFSYFGFRTQFGNMAIQLSAILSVQFDAIILSIYSDSSEVARYGLVAKVFLFVVTLYHWMTAQENIEAIKVESQGRIFEASRDSIQFIIRLVVYTSIVIIPLTFVLKQILSILSVRKINFNYFEILISIIWCLSLLVTTKLSRILYAKGIYKGYFQIGMLVSMINVALTFWLCSYGFGMIGPLIATILSIFLVYVPCYLYLHRRMSPK